MLRLCLLLAFLLGVSGFPEIAQHIYNLCEDVNPFTGVFTYSVGFGCAIQKRAIASIISHDPNIVESFKKKCDDLLPLYLMKGSPTENQVVLPYERPELGQSMLLGYAFKYRGDCGAWRQIEIRVQDTKKYSVPEKLPKIHHIEEGKDAHFKPYTNNSATQRWIYYVW